MPTAKAKTGAKKPTRRPRAAAVTTAEEQQKAPAKPKTKGKPRGRPFQPGQSGNPAGRPPSSRHRLSEGFLAAMADAFEKQGAKAVKEVAENEPVKFLRLCVQALPKHVETTGEDGETVGVNTPIAVTDAQIDARLEALLAEEDGEAGVDAEE